MSEDRDRLREWLEAAGLAHRLARFLEQDVQVWMLSDLTDADLVELGLSVADRERFFEHRAARRGR